MRGHQPLGQPAPVKQKQRAGMAELVLAEAELAGLAAEDGQVVRGEIQDAGRSREETWCESKLFVYDRPEAVLGALASKEAKEEEAEH